MEMDLAGTGQNLLATVPVTVGIAPFSIGVVIQNNVPPVDGGTAPACALNVANYSYPTSSACFDSLTIPTVKPCTIAGTIVPTPTLVTSAPAALNGSVLSATDPASAANNATDANCYQSGDELLVFYIPQGAATEPTCNSGTHSNPSGKFPFCLGVVTLTQNAQVSGGLIQLQPSAAGPSNDPLGIIYNSSGTQNFMNAYGQNYSYSSGSTYIVDLGTAANTVTYSVQTNPANAADQQLVRCESNTCSVVVDQIVGFKMGATLWGKGATGATDLASYFYNALNYCNDALGGGVDCSTNPQPNDPLDYTLIRAVRVSMIGRTPPSPDMALRNFKNAFDGGPYLIQQASVVVDLRGISDTEY